MIFIRVNIYMDITNLAGKLLVAPPKILDRRFNNTVIYIASHTSAGAWGLVVNKPITNVTASSVLARVDIPLLVEGEIYAGGPVNNTSINFLHTSEVVTDDTVYDESGICVSGNLSFVNELYNGFWPRQYRVVIGACTWGPGQLEGEIRGEHPWSPEHSWLIAPAVEEVIFELNGIDQWRAAVELSARCAVKDWMN